jgi:hypothetical protein
MCLTLDASSGVTQQCEPPDATVGLSMNADGRKWNKCEVGLFGSIFLAGRMP